MKKITEIIVPFTRVTVLPDAFGNLRNHTEEHLVRRKVVNVSSGLRFAHHIIDLIGYKLLLIAIDYLSDLTINLTGSNYPVSRTFVFLSTVVTILLYPAYYVFFEYFFQRTPAKFLTNSIVINEYGNKPNFRTILFRSFIRIVPFEPLSYLGNDERGWHDKWSDTWVVKISELTTIKELQQE